MKWRDRSLKYEPDEVKMVIHFLSSGYYDAGCTYGPPESCYPPEGEEERTLDYIEIEGIELPQEIAEKIFEKFQERIDALEIDPPEYEPLEDDVL